VNHALHKAPDEAPAPTTKALPFIKDPNAAEVLRNDVAAVERAIHNGEWKAATDLPGSVIEALLLWALWQDKARTMAAQSADQKSAIDEWKFWRLIKVARERSLISDFASKQADLARDYRNLIHASVTGRLKMVADATTRAT